MKNMVWLDLSADWVGTITAGLPTDKEYNPFVEINGFGIWFNLAQFNALKEVLVKAISNPGEQPEVRYKNGR
ncbi:hypothetical protein ES702_07342 [subsurface metagenome]